MLRYLLFGYNDYDTFASGFADYYINASDDFDELKDMLDGIYNNDLTYFIQDLQNMRKYYIRGDYSKYLNKYNNDSIIHNTDYKNYKYMICIYFHNFNNPIIGLSEKHYYMTNNKITLLQDMFDKFELDNKYLNDNVCNDISIEVFNSVTIKTKSCKCYYDKNLKIHMV